MLPPLLAALEFRSNNAALPAGDRRARRCWRRYADVDGKRRFYDAADARPARRRRPAAWRDAVVDEQGRVERDPVRAVRAGRAAGRAAPPRDLRRGRRRAGATPRTTCPPTSTTTATSHYAALRQPLDPTEFIAALRERMTAALDRARRSAGATAPPAGCGSTRRRGEPWISVPKLDALPEPAQPRRAQGRGRRAAGARCDLLDVLKEADFLTGFTDEFASVASPRGDRPRRRCAAGCCCACSRWAPTSASAGSSPPASTARARPRCATSAATTSPATTCAARSPPWPTRTFAARDPALVGRGHGVRVGLEEVRLLGVEPDDRVARPLRRSRGDDLLARRARQRLHLLPAQDAARPPRSRR